MHEHDWAQAASQAAQDPDPVAGKIVLYARLLTPGAATAREIGAFMAANPSWPDQGNLRHRLADAIADDADANRVRADCAAFKPAVDTALLRCAAAEREAGHAARAVELAGQAWIAGVRDEAAELEDFAQAWPDAAPPAVQWRRFDALDWLNDPAAMRQAARLDPGQRALADARLAFQHRDPRALDFLPAIPEALRADPALLLEQGRWLRLTDAGAAALALWRSAGAHAEAQAAPEHRAAFWNERDRLARVVLAQGDTDGAAFLADDSLAGPDQWPDALFLSGWIALRRQHDAKRAVQKFDALQAVSHSLITQARAWYWAARATTGDAATQSYQRAAAYPTTYYGQLAIATLGGDGAVAAAISRAADPETSAEQQNSFESQELVHAARTLVRWDDPHWARQFLLAQMQTATDAASFVLCARAAESLGLPEVGVQTARVAGKHGIALPHVGYPSPVDPPPGADRALVLGLMRQESSFDAGVTSGAGAVGLMQLMQATARQVAGKGQGHLDLKDPGENMRLGTAYLNSLLAQFDGVRAYAVAAYNAGPHRVHGWIDTNGDPAEDPDGLIDWIEEIPFSETRNYVQRVLENTRIYAARQAP